MSSSELFCGEQLATIDERHRVSIPEAWAKALLTDGGECVLAKERPGALSIWPLREKQRIDDGVNLLAQKMRLQRLEDRTEDLVALGRLLSTHHTTVPVDGRGRLTVPKGFREFLGVEPGGSVYVVGAAVCVELWRPDAWMGYVEQRMPDFRQLFEQLSR